MWNSSLVEVYMAHKNIPNNFLMVPIMLFIIGVVAVCVYQTLITGNLCFNIIYWGIVAIVSTVVLIPFFRNETFRRKTFETEKVIKKYNEYKKEHQEMLEKKNSRKNKRR